MKQNALLKRDRIAARCTRTACVSCNDCKVTNMEERRMELTTPSLQLYAKEAEHYFFYFDVNKKQA